MWERGLSRVLLLGLFALLMANQALALDCYVGCVGQACLENSGLPKGAPVLVSNVEATVASSDLPAACYSICEPLLGATVFGQGGQSTLSMAKLLANQNGAEAAICSTNACNKPSVVSPCPQITPNNNNSIIPAWMQKNIRESSIGTCQSLNNGDLGGSDTLCQYTMLGVYCPPNYYCPPYSVEEIYMYTSILDSHSCSYGMPVIEITGNFSYAVMCPCTPGFLCPGNTAIPSFCPKGYYCPPNPAFKTTPFGLPISSKTGLGAFGSLAIQCPADSWCSEGLVVPFDCDLKLMDCPPGTVHPSTYKVVICISILFLAVYLPIHVRFVLAKIRRVNKRLKWEQEREALKDKLREQVMQNVVLEENEIGKNNDEGIEAGGGTSALAILNSKKTIRELRDSLGIAPITSSLASRSGLGSITQDLRMTEGDPIPNPIRAADSRFSSLKFVDARSSNTKVAPLGVELNDMSGKYTGTDGVNIKFEDYCYKAPNGKTIMYRVSGEFRAGRMCAIMGPSGAGKSTIISLITGKAVKSGGTVSVNGKNVGCLTDHPDCVGRVGFVPQEDVMLRDLSAQENIAFSARYRLPTTLSLDEIENRINETIDVLELEKIKDEVVGDERTRGISGGQRKRVNVGIELVTDPKVLFLDEPTSGLDSTKSRRLCKILIDLTRKRGMTVAAVIHQPSKEAFEMFDDLLLLGAGGSVMYFGELKGPRGAEAYFRALGFDMPLGTNPAEFFLDVAQGEIEHKDLLPVLSTMKDKKIYLLNEWHDKRAWDASKPWTEIKESDILIISKQDSQQPEEAIEGKRRSHSLFNAQVQVADPEFEHIQTEILAQETMKDFAIKRFHDIKEHLGLIYHDAVVAFDYRHWPATIRTSAWQFFLSLKRSIRYYREERAIALFGEMAMHCFSGLIVSCAGQKLMFTGPLPPPVCAIMALPLQPACYMPQNALYTQIGNFICFGGLFTAIASSSEVFSTEQPNYWRECSSGLLTVPYFFGHFVGNIPRMVLSATLFWLSFCFMYRDTGNGMGLGLFFIIVGLYWFGYAIGYFTSQIASPQNTALMGVIWALIFSVLFSGVLPVLKDVQSWPKWIQFPWSLSGPRWAIEAFYINSIEVFETVPKSKYNDLYVGAPYVDIVSVLDDVGYKADNFSTDIWGLVWNGLLWTFAALSLMYVMNRHKTR